MSKLVIVILIFLYGILPPLILAYTQKLIYRNRNVYGPHLQYTFKYLITLSFIPLLMIDRLDIGIIPLTTLSIISLTLTYLFALLGIKRSLKQKNIFFYFAGIMAAFMEEILYRGVIFSLTLFAWQDQWLALLVSSFLFGIWHLKNYYWVGKKRSIIQFLYTTFIYGPLFCLMRIYTGDIYLAIFFHYLTDATCALSPDYLRGWLVKGGRGKPYDDSYVIPVLHGDP